MHQVPDIERLNPVAVVVGRPQTEHVPRRNLEFIFVHKRIQLFEGLK